MANKTVLVAVCVLAVLCASPVLQVVADVLIGSCVRGAVNYKSNCEGFCRSRGYKNGHCGSFANVNCWCET